MIALIWLMERKMLFALRKVLGIAEGMHYFGKRRIALEVLSRINEADEAITSGGEDVLVAALTKLAEDAVFRKQNVLIYAEASSEPPWYAATIIELWSTARLKMARGEISPEAFEEMDELVLKFINDVLTPREVAKCLGMPEPEEEAGD